MNEGYVHLSTLTVIYSSGLECGRRSLLVVPMSVIVEANIDIDMTTDDSNSTAALACASCRCFLKPFWR